MTYLVSAINFSNGLLRPLKLSKQWCASKRAASSIAKKLVSSAKSEWNDRLISRIQGKFPEIELFQDKEDGLLFGNLNVGKTIIMFKGATPLVAVEDLQEILKLVDLSVQQKVSAKIDALANLIAHLEN